MEINKKVAIVTGARRGIGLGISKALGRAGYHIVMVALSPDASEALESVKKEGGSCEYVSCDVSDEEARIRLIRRVSEQYGRIDVLVNNAGVAPEVRMDVLETTTESYDRLMKINARSAFFMCQHAANAMISFLQKGGLKDYSPRIVNTSSVSAYTSSTSRGEYCVSKAAISMVTKLFADRLAEYSIPVFEVRPGIILTDMTKCVQDKYRSMIEGGLTPIKRFGTPRDVANCVLAACSGLLDFSTGQVLNADGGFHIRRL
ncbi:3-ketoacyl-ACP reductase [Caproiciproducens sp. NJN-50]|uniref:3-ketoacyl-ACP reductase n=1 Tax=Caproiciproducens sp. NJN-50 TaxID=2507162 RepID=UPI000FFE1AC6|nr:3-ketoacyl-ACP reductase [Caproiciproducens sp. NJN-50]QAT48788.1 3-ketoacyl-ACP reductase [Caproiciproducens sp. NJN-50]